MFHTAQPQLQPSRAARCLALVLGLGFFGCSVQRAPLGRDVSGINAAGTGGSGAGGSGGAPVPMMDAGLPPSPEAGPAACANPTMEECDGLDNDCNGEVDEGQVCAPCSRHVRQDVVYLYCQERSDFAQARAWCQARGYDMVIVDGQAEDEWLWDTGLLETGSAGPADWWIGLYDPTGSLTSFEWVDGTPAWDLGVDLTYVNWAPRYPNQAGACVEKDYRGGDWHNVPCSQRQAFVCELMTIP